VLSGRQADPLTAEKADLARRHVLEGKVERARREKRAHDLNAALATLRSAIPYATDAAPIEKSIATIEAERGRIEEEIARARDMLDREMDRGAYRILSPIALYAKTFPEISTLLNRARVVTEEEDAAREAAVRREGVAKALDAARREEERGKPGAALTALFRQREELGDLPELADAETALRSRTVTALRRRAADQLTAGHPATAALLLFAAKAFTTPGPGVVEPNDDAALPEFVTEVSCRVKIDEFEDATRGRADPMILHRELVAALAATPPGPWISFSPDARDPALLVTGTVEHLDVREEKPVVRREVHEYVERVDQRVNRELPRLNAELNELRELLDDSREVYDAVEFERIHLERMRNSAVVNRGGRRWIGPYQEPLYFRLLANTRARESKARRGLERLEREVDDLATLINETPAYIENPVRGEYRYDAVERTKTSRCSASFRIAAVSAGSPFEPRLEEVSAKHVETDREVAGNPEVGLPADPPELPGDAATAELAMSGLAEKLAARISPLVMELRRGYYDQGRSLERAGDKESAIDRYAAFLLTAGGAFPLERANAMRRVRERWGIEVVDGIVDVRGLELDR